MITTTTLNFKENVDKYFKNIIDDFEKVFISNDNDNNMVLLSLDEYNSLVTTKHELSSEKNKKRLDSAIRKFNKGDYFEKDLIES